MEIKVECPIQVGDLVWVKPEDSYNFIQSKVTNVFITLEGNHVAHIQYFVEDLDYELSKAEDGIFLNKEDIFKFYADELCDKIPEEFGKYVFCDKPTTIYQKINNLIGELNTTLNTPNISDVFAAQIKSTIEQLNKIKQGY